jgi:DNA polymerase-3 subunit alpha
MSDKPFVHLHLHTGYSLLDGMIHLNDLIDSAIDNSMDSVAITDHGNIFGAVQFSQKANSKGLKGIIGCEIYLAPNSRFDDDIVGIDGRRPYSHLILLCKDEVGYKNLSHLLTLSYQEGFKYKPRADKELLSRFSKGLIASSACLGGEIPRKIRMGKFDDALKSAVEFEDIFGKGNFYLELQDHGLPQQVEVNSALIEIHKKTNIPLIVTNDVHFLKKEDFESHKVLLCIQTKTTLKERETSKKEAYTEDHYLKTKEEMWEKFGDYKDALLNTFKIAEECNFNFDFETHHFPKFEVPSGYSLEGYLEEIVRNGFDKKVYKNPSIPKDKVPIYKERLDYELDLILKMQFAGYFLIVSDFVKYAKDSNIPVGPGRGSAAGSLVSYCLDITDIDPIYFNLLFERFLNPERVSMPDIDIDFCKREREKVIDYVRKKYGKENVAQIITFGQLQSRIAIRDVGRVLGIDLKKIDKVSKLIPVEQGTVLDLDVASKTVLKEFYDKDSEIKRVIDFAKKIEHLPRHAGMHAAGVVIAPDAVTNFCPLYRSSKGDDVTQFEKDDITAIGLLKIDFLGLKTMTVISDTIEMIKKSKKKVPNLKDISLDDSETFNLFSSGNTDAVFQFESPGMKDALRRLKPTKFEQLIVMNALYRPGPLGAGILNDYIERAHNKEKISYLIDDLKEILEETLGVIVYQEQVMQIANKIAGFSLAEADLLRQAISKKNQEKMRILEQKFRKGAQENKYKNEVIDQLIEQIKYFGGYGFNKSHSAAYALVAYWTGYLKAHYPTEYMAATLSNSMDKTEDIIKYMNSCTENGIKLLPPDVNSSEEGFTVEKNAIRYGLTAIKNVGLSSVEEILKARKRIGAFKTIYQFCEEVEHEYLNKRVLENLIQSGAMDCFKVPRWDLFEAVDSALQLGNKIQQDRKKGQGGLFGEEDNPDYEVSYPKAKPWEKIDLYQREKQSLGFYLSGHPLTERQPLLKLLTTHTIVTAKNSGSGEYVAVGGVISSHRTKKSKETKEPYMDIELEDMESTIEVRVRGEAYNKCLKFIEKNSTVLVIGRITKDADKVRIFADCIVLLDRAEEELKDYISAVEITLPITLLDNDFITTLKNLLVSFKGNTEVRFRVLEDEETSVIIKPASEYFVKASQDFKKAIDDTVGKDRLKYNFKITNKRTNGWKNGRE